eukprot:CAMPEP_0181330652 /NCGR_PEP_ID=MMETSP1101-20121128/24021_1 /TAXON_ID=46948 /ORGANISM="Rhodomonas abbreviata, Strain Caron Lab Isolate" /LENGTH=88 /DNA_ID=CAMNT_0023439937 /DNA_START=409 /DNA_END=671 /DNA_ORIENTATION=+
MSSLAEGELVLAGHAAQLPSPVQSLYVPAAHGLQAPPSLPVCPVLHVQLVISGLARGESELLAHRKQMPSPVKFLYVPASHGWQAVPS